MPTVAEQDSRVLAEAWLEVDPDVDHQAIVSELLERGGDELERCFGRPLRFGTAGLRGPLAPGPGAMNRVLVRVVATAIGKLVIETMQDRAVVIGFDARHQSRTFAEDTARVLAGMGIDITLFDRHTPTPVLAFAVHHLEASAGVMVTASHNPRTDNGYKVYWRDGAQIRSPIDTKIAELIDNTPLVSEDQLTELNDPHIRLAGDALVDAYLDGIVGLLTPGTKRTARVAYTPLHGVGRDTIVGAFAGAGFPPPAIVEQQADPDPEFPTTPFPNPEEPGVLDHLLALASEIDADVAIANDPDADRLAVAVPVGKSWRLLSGDELGCLLGEHLLSRRGDNQPVALVVNTVVSSRLLEQIARHHDALYEQTLTGFKWIMAAGDARPDAAFVLGYEEALGYCIGEVVRDKDGVSAALVVAEMVSESAARGRTLLDLLDDVHRRHGAHVTGQRSLRFEPSTDITPTAVMADLRMHPPVTIGGEAVRRFSDLERGDGPLPSTDAIVIGFKNGQIVVRPSGTEAKLKVYGEMWAKPGSSDLVGDRVESHVRLHDLLSDVVARLGDPERQRTLSSLATDDLDAKERAAQLFSAVPEGVDRAAALRLIVRCLDLTTLCGDDTPGLVRALCAQARRPDPADPTVGPVAGICVYPAFVELASEITSGTGISVASVAGAFPSGLSALSVRLADIEQALEAGADEIDVVLNRSAFLSGHAAIAARELREIRHMAGDTPLNVIIEVHDLGSLGAVREATKLAIEAGADWVQTSTGNTELDATPASVLSIAETIAEYATNGGRTIGLKVSGGLQEADTALGYMSIVGAVLGSDWLMPERLRFGASELVRSVVAHLAGTEYRLAHSLATK